MTKTASKKNVLFTLAYKRLFFIIILITFFSSSHAELGQHVTATATNIIGMQYLAPYRKELKKFSTAIQSIEEYYRNNPTAPASQIQQLEPIYRAYSELTHRIENYDIIFSLFSLNEQLKEESFTPLIDFKNYEHDLYVTCSAFNKEQDSYSENHLLEQLAQHTQLKCGYVKCAKVIGMPTTDIRKLKCTQDISKTLLHETTLLEEIESHLKEIKEKHLEDAFLSFWKDDSIANITSFAPYATNSNFGPVIELLFTIKKMKDGDIAELQEAIGKLDKSTSFIGTVNWTTFIQDAGMVLFGTTMLANGWKDLKDAATSIPSDFNYLGQWKILAMPIILPIIKMLIDTIIDFSLKKRIQQEFTFFTELCKNNNLMLPASSTLSTNKIILNFNHEKDATIAQNAINKNMPHSQATTEKNILVLKLTTQEERSFRFSHPLMQHHTLVTIVIPCVLYLFACHFFYDTPLLSWGNDVRNNNHNHTQQDHFNNIPFTNIAFPAPGFALLPWHTIKMLTSTGLIPAYAFQHFWKTPQKSILRTTQSIQLARKTLLDFAQLIDHVKKIQTLLIKNPVIRSNLYEVIEDLDVEKCLQQKIDIAKKLLLKKDAILRQHGYTKNTIKKAFSYLESTQKELSALLDTLQAYVYETESTGPHSWFSPKGLIKNINIRFGSNDILAAYKIMLSIKDIFSHWLEALGEIDRKIAEVKLIKSFAQKNINFCFAEYEKQETPHLAATGLWLPHLLNKTQPNNIIANSIEVGKKGQASTIILSGPTEGGKSTIERSIGIAALMAQTVGIVPATRWISTPLDRLLISFNAADNIGKIVGKTADNDTKTGTSGFRDEVEAIKKIINEKKQLGKDKRILVIIDELFQKVQRSGEFFSYEIIKQNFINDNNTLSLIVSHREQPKYLENETAGLCKNYHFILSEINGKLLNTYHLEQGALLRPEHTTVSLPDIMNNQEDIYNLQLLQEAGILTIPAMINTAA